MSVTAIVEEDLSVDRAVNAVKHEAAGAVATFVGVVRNHAGGLAVEKLEYHAYLKMAETELASVADEIEAEIEGTRLCCLHRIGELQVGEAAVVCAASSPHRAEAFRACRELIDRVKARVPIWKREHGPDGPYWVGWKDART
jgi:molybdopterin synthase catalytic subunit